jgi:hypothetical protein
MAPSLADRLTAAAERIEDEARSLRRLAAGAETAGTPEAEGGVREGASLPSRSGWTGLGVKGSGRRSYPPGVEVPFSGRMDRPAVTGPEDAAAYLAPRLIGLEQEQLWVLALDSRNRITDAAMIYQGSVNQATVRVAEVYREAIRRGAVALVVIHNHPSGDPTPSSADITLTTALEAAGALLDLELLDHIIIGEREYLSLRKHGLGFTGAQARKGGRDS